MSSKKFLSEVYLENVLLRVPGSIYWKDRNGVYLGCNAFQAKMVGIASPADIVGLTDYDLPWKNDAETLIKTDQQVMQTEQSQELIEQAVFEDGTSVVVLTNKSPLYNDKGEVMGVIGTSLDLEVVKALEQRERRAWLEVEKATAKAEHEVELRKAAEALGSSLAHELRTPLASIDMGLAGLKKHLPALLASYKIARQHDLSVPNISASVYRILEDLVTNLQCEIRKSNLFIDMLLHNVKADTLMSEQSHPISINHCIEDALARYPFNNNQRQCVHWQAGDDFLFHGNPLMIVHALFNLLKNALFYIGQAQKGDITIWFSFDEHHNILHFKDTGAGMPESMHPHLFQRFVSRRYNGTGLGLAFCKEVMKGLQGKIECRSQEGVFTEFLLYFPKV